MRKNVKIIYGDFEKFFCNINSLACSSLNELWDGTRSGKKTVTGKKQSTRHNFILATLTDNWRFITSRTFISMRKWSIFYVDSFVWLKMSVTTYHLLFYQFYHLHLIFFFIAHNSSFVQMPKRKKMKNVKKRKEIPEKNHGSTNKKDLRGCNEVWKNSFRNVDKILMLFKSLLLSAPVNCLGFNFKPFLSFDKILIIQVANDMNIIMEEVFELGFVLRIGICTDECWVSNSDFW